MDIERRQHHQVRLPQTKQIVQARKAKLKQRMGKEFRKIIDFPIPYITVAPISTSNLLEWIACIQGPSNSPYQGQLYKLQIFFPDEYPFRPPYIQFKTKIMHPNVNFEDGKVVMDILHDQYSPAITIQKMLIAIRVLMAEPRYLEWNKEDKEEFQKRAAEFTKEQLLAKKK